MVEPAGELDSLWRAAHERDATWLEAVRRLPPAQGQRLLRLADLEGVRGPEGAARARACYLALSDGLDPTAALDRPRIEALLQSDLGVLPALEPLWMRTRSGSDPGLAAQAAARLGLLADARGDRTEAECQYRWALAEALPLGGRVASGVLAACASFAIEHGRELESLAYVRRADALLDVGAPRWQRAQLSWIEARVYTVLEDWPRQARAAERFGQQARDCDDAHQRRAAPELADLAAQHALAQGDAEAALHSLEEAQDSSAPFADLRAARQLSWSADMVRALVLGGRPGEAAQLARDTLWPLAPDDASAVPLRLAALLARRALGDSCAALEGEATALLSLLTGEAAARLGLCVRRVLSTRLASLLSEEGGCSTLVRRAYDLAASLSLERLLEVERFSREYPDLAQPSAEDLVLFNGQRHRLAAQHAKLPKTVARHLSRALYEGHPIADHLPCEDGHVPICAWCQRLRIRGQRWLTVQQFFPLAPANGLRVTHCVCERCADGIRAELAALSPGPRPPH